MRNKFLLLLLPFCFLPVLGEKTSTTTAIPPEILDRTGYALIIIITTPLLCYVLLISFIGHRMKRTGIRWFTINICIWGLVHMAYLSSYWSDANTNIAPFPNWFTFELWDYYGKNIGTMTRSVFAFGIGFLLIEKMILICSPMLEDNNIFNGIFAFIFLIYQNGFLLWMFHYHSVAIDGNQICPALSKIPVTPPENCYWYFPIELFSMTSFVVHSVITALYFIFCLFGTCCCCYSLANFNNSKKKIYHFTEMWLLLLYANVPILMTAAAFASSVISLVITKFWQWILDSGYISLITGNPGPVEPIPGATPGPSPSPPLITLHDLLHIGGLFMQATNWCIALFPLVEVLMSLFFFQMYREQLFFLISCGNLFGGSAKKLEKHKSKQQPGVIRMIPAQNIQVPPQGTSTIVTVTPRDIEKTPVETPPGNY